MIGPFASYFDRAGQAFLRGADLPGADFSQPIGEPALVAPDSISWRVFKNPATLFVGGVAAVLLEFADPRVRTGVWENTTFKSDPVGRLRRTGLAAMVTIYGAHSMARRMINGVNRMHSKISGETPSGEAWRADDPELLTWVQATASFGFLEAYGAYAAPLADAERDRYYAEARGPALLYGARGAPASQSDLRGLFEEWAPRFERSDIVFEFLRIIRRAPALPTAARFAQGMLVRAAVDIVPPSARCILGLGPESGLRAVERRLVETIARRADRLVLPSSPAVRSCIRLGLPADYLFR